MKQTLKKTLLTATLGLLFNLVTPAAHASLVLTFTDSAATAAKSGACSGTGWTAGAEFRWCSNGIVSGGSPTQKNTINGGEAYGFSDAGVMTSVTGTPGNVGALVDPGSAAPISSTNPSWQQIYYFNGVPLNFLAPVLGSLAGTAYDPAAYVGGAPTSGVDQLFLHVPVLEMQWGGSWMSLGSASGGVNFTADISNVVTVGSSTTFDFNMFANELIDFAEDPNSIGFAAGGWTAQWHMQGSGVYTAPVPIPAAIWLFGSGLLGLSSSAYIGVARRRKVKVA